MNPSVADSRPSPSRTAADALVAAGLVPAARADAAAAVISAHLPRGGQYSFAADAEFLLSCLEHHVSAYFSQVLEPTALSHHSVQRGGRLMADGEIQEAAIDITSQVMNELGGDYVLHMERYFGDDAGTASFVYSRVHGALLDAARKFNDEYLGRLSKKIGSRRLEKATQQTPA